VQNTAPILVNHVALSDCRTTGDISRLVTASGRDWLTFNATELKLALLILVGVECASLLT
jgi:hypothetical protein